MLKRLVLLDIDGTLLVTGGAGKAALRAAMERVYGETGDVEHYDMGGRTLIEIVRDLLADSSISAEELRERFPLFTTAWAQELRRVINNYNVRICPGAPELVHELASNKEALLGLLTANIEETAEIKLVAAGFSPRQFGVGAFGDAAENRADLVPIAMAQAEALTGVRFEPKQVVIIGDSVRDVQTAQLAGARSIVVATGEHSREMLEAAGADYVFNDLSNTKKVLRAIFAS